MKIKLTNDVTVTIYWKHIKNEKPFGTWCIIEFDGTKKRLEQRSMVGSKDQFCKAKGRVVSLTKALKFLNFSKSDRTLIWQEYLKTTKHSPFNKKAQ